MGKIAHPWEGSAMSCTGWFVIGLVVGALVLIGQALALAQAKKAYFAALERLKRDPHNPDLREEALARGRAYAGVSKGLASAGVTVFDEVALMNDINAACARAGMPQAPAPQPAAPVAQVRFLCPSCKQVLVAGAHLVGKQVKCSRCGGTVQVP
jgi:hypothetical protein